MIDMRNKFLKFTLCFLLAGSFIQAYDAMETTLKKASEVETDKNKKKEIDEVITQIQKNKNKENKSVQSSKNMKERLQKLNDQVYDDMDI